MDPFELAAMSYFGKNLKTANYSREGDSSSDGGISSSSIAKGLGSGGKTYNAYSGWSAANTLGSNQGTRSKESGGAMKGPAQYLGDLLALAPAAAWLPIEREGSGGTGPGYYSFSAQKRRKNAIEEAQQYMSKKQALELEAMKEQLANSRAQRAIATRKPIVALRHGISDWDSDRADRINAARDREYLEKRRALELEAMKKQMEMANMMREINTTNKTLGTGFDTQVVNDAGRWRTINLPWEKKLQEEQNQTTNNTYGNIG